jgi:hypothetical protein
MEKAVRATAEVWRERIAAQQAGGQSIRALCKQNGWHEHAFYWWRSRLGLSPVSVIRRGRRRKMPAGFAEVVIDRPVAEVSLVQPRTASEVEPMRLCLLGGRELVLPASMSDQRVAALVCLIEGRGSMLGGDCDSK